jgi:GTP cyclohydrolase I
MEKEFGSAAAEKLSHFLSHYSKPAELPQLTSIPYQLEDQVVLFRNLPFYGLCAHHLLPVRGFVTIAFSPNQFIVGLSSFKRLIKALTQTPLMQEKLTDSLIEMIDQKLHPKGIALHITATHTCSQASSGEWQVLETYSFRGCYTLRNNPLQHLFDKSAVCPDVLHSRSECIECNETHTQC